MITRWQKFTQLHREKKKRFWQFWFAFIVFKHLEASFIIGARCSQYTQEKTVFVPINAYSKKSQTVKGCRSEKDIFLFDKGDGMTLSDSLEISRRLCSGRRTEPLVPALRGLCWQQPPHPMAERFPRPRERRTIPSGRGARVILVGRVSQVPLHLPEQLSLVLCIHFAPRLLLACQLLTQKVQYRTKDVSMISPCYLN